MASLIKPLIQPAAPKFAAPPATFRNRKWVLARRPEGVFKPGDLRLEEEDLSEDTLEQDEVRKGFRLTIASNLNWHNGH